MIVVIQCAAKKRDYAGSMTHADGRKVLFVADPSKAPDAPSVHWARPDDTTANGRTWRQELLACQTGANDLGLLPAWELYANPAYELLHEAFGPERLYILSAGWGLIAAEFKTPNYDITFSPSADPYKRRRKKHRYADFRMLGATESEPVAFLGGKDYIDLFCDLTSGLPDRTIYYNSATPPSAPGCVARRYETSTRTNWHYECARAMIDGSL